MLTVLLGDYGSGKTTTAKMLAKQNGGVYLDIDVIAKCEKTPLDALKDIIQPDKNYYLDGWNNYHGPDIPGVNYIVCMAQPSVIIERQKKKAGVSIPLPRTIDDITRITYWAACVALTHSSEPVFVDTTSNPVAFWPKKYWQSQWKAINLYDQLKSGQEYQDIEIGDKVIRGLSESYKTWDRLKELVDFRGKSVCDYGCNMGYFSFKAEQAGGASPVIGIDEHAEALSIAFDIGIACESQVKFVQADLLEYQPPDTDIILALNVLHHLKYDHAVLERMFTRAREVAIEMPVSDLTLCHKYAIKQGCSSVVANSHRADRCIAVFSKQKLKTVPIKYVYRPRLEALKKLRLFRIVYITLPWTRQLVKAVKRKTGALKNAE